jgi:hypothetical protein
MTTSCPDAQDVIHKTITCIQLFDRKRMGILWANRSKLDPGQVPILKALYDNKQRGTLQCKTPITYKLSSSIPGKLGYGRYYGSKGSLETLEKDLRSTLCVEYYTDVDIVNCHPTLIAQMSHNLFKASMPSLEHYVKNRDSVFQSLQKDFNISSENAKTLVTKVLYNGVIDMVVPKLIHNIQHEVKDLQAKLAQLPEHAKLLTYCRKNKDNVYGSFLSYIIQTEERRCLDAMLHYFDEHGYSADVLAYDGCMIRKKDVNMSDIQAFIKTRTGYDVLLKIKELIPIDLEKQGFLDVSDVEMLSDVDRKYMELKTSWEKDHFYFKPSNTIVEIEPSGVLKHYTISHASEAFNYLTLGEDLDGSEIQFLKRWRQDPTRRIVDRLVYKTQSDCAKNEVSLFQGFSYTKLSPCECPQAVSVFQNVLHAICGDDDTVFDYVLKSFAHILQKPFQKTGVCIIFASKIQGTGKDTVMLWLSKILGNHVSHYTDDDDFWNLHDTKKEGAILMYLEEAGGLANKAKANALKARITCDSITINPKGLTSYTVPNIARYIMTTNEVCPVKFEESDRRYVIVTPSPRLASSRTGNFEFWNDVYLNLEENPNWLRSVGDFLACVDLSGWNPRALPETEVRRLASELVQETSEKLFLMQWEGVDVATKDLYSEYKSFCIENDLHYKGSLISFGMSLANYPELVERRKNNKHMLFSRKHNGGDLET